MHFLARRPIITRMRIPIAQSQWCNYRVISLPATYVLDIWPSDAYPKGDEARQIAWMWVVARGQGHPGLLLLGCDVAADPDDLDAMTAAVAARPGDLHTGLVKLWPESTGRNTFMWSHRQGTIGMPVVTSDESGQVSYVSLGFLWVPGRLLDLVSPLMGPWQHGETDVRLSEIALSAGIPAYIVSDCRPKHLHFQKEHDGTYIRRQALRSTRIDSPEQG